MKFAFLLFTLIPSFAFATRPQIVDVISDLRGGFVSWTEVYSDGVVSHRVCSLALAGKPAVGYLTARDLEDPQEVFYQRHLHAIRTWDVEQSTVRMDKRGQVVVWSGGFSADGGEVLFKRHPNGQVHQVQILTSSHSPEIIVTDVAKVNEIESIVLARYVQGGAQILP